VNAEQALAFVERNGIVLASAGGPVPTLAHAIAGEPVRGSWWGHPKSHAIFHVLEAVYDSPHVLVCKLIGGKVTLVHRRLWPALVRLADRLPRAGLAAVREEHTERGSHRVVTTPFPRWVPPDVLEEGRAMAGEEAESLLGRAALDIAPKSGPARRASGTAGRSRPARSAARPARRPRRR
jgi:hypothetical protein